MQKTHENYRGSRICLTERRHRMMIGHRHHRTLSTTSISPRVVL